MQNPNYSILSSRRSGILLHITSLPNHNIGQDAFRFVDFLKNSGFGIWQFLPLCPTHSDQSPYNGTSAFAGNPSFIDTSFLKEEKYQSIPIDKDNKNTFTSWSNYFGLFNEFSSNSEQKHYKDFINQNSFWIEDYALYCVIKQKYDSLPWTKWPEKLKKRNANALNDISENYPSIIDGIYFQQYVFSCQWQSLKNYANNNNILFFGDLPIFVAHDSADCWANQHLFELDREGLPTFIAGVPPDYFSETGQRWGNPQYNWQAIEEDGFQWWLNRFAHNFQLFDLVRVDHFRGFESCWKIPANEETAINGFWEKTPGDKLFSLLQQTHNNIPIVAEDLGIITEEVNTLREKYAFPGMKILQFAFDDNSQNPYLPHNHIPGCVVYTGTHDNDTTLGWYNSLPDERKNFLTDYLGYGPTEMPWPLIQYALASVANTTIIPMQDILVLDSEHRMNTPGTTENNWQWQFSWQQIPPKLSSRLWQLNNIYNRIK